jgi:hypothetical protein
MVASLTVALPPVITTQPVSQVLNAGDTASFKIVVSSTLPIEYQWYKDATSLYGQTNTTLWLTNIGRNFSGNYSVEVTNAVGNSTSSNATLRVRSPQVLQPPIYSVNGRFQISSTDFGGGIPLASDAPYLQLMVSTNLKNWKALTNLAIMTNDLLIFEDSENAHQPYRFYRVQEK